VDAAFVELAGPPFWLQPPLHTLHSFNYFGWRDNHCSQASLQRSELQEAWGVLQTTPLASSVVRLALSSAQMADITVLIDEHLHPGVSFTHWGLSLLSVSLMRKFALTSHQVYILSTMLVAFHAGAVG
jgi:hypothetical protein